MLLAVGLLSGCSRDSGPPPAGPLTVEDDHGATLLSVGPLKDGRPQEPFSSEPYGAIRSGRGQTSYHAETGIINLYVGRLAEGRHDNLFLAAAEIESDIGSVATDLQAITIGGQPAVALRCRTDTELRSTYAVVIFHTATGTVWFELQSDTAHFDQAWAAVTSSLKVAKTVPLKGGTSLRAFPHDTNPKRRTCTAP